MFLADIPLNIDWQQILLHLLNFVILVGGLYFLLYGPVKKFMEKRKAHYDELENKAKTNLDNAKIKEEEVTEKLNNLANEIANKRALADQELAAYREEQKELALKEADDILKKATINANREKDKILDSANKEIKNLVTEATRKVASSNTSEIFEQFLEAAKDSEEDENN